jgi:LCP family protein required for cell wall assembly
MAEHGVGEERVKTAYTYGEHYQVPGGGVSLLAQTLSLNFGLSFDRYIAADFAGFAEGIDALGGVQVTLNEPVGTQGTPGYFPAGLTLLDGERALVLARARPDNSSDLGRIERQTLILRAVRDKALSPQMADQVPALLDTLRQATRTDLSAAELTMLVCVARQLDDASTRTITLSGRTSLIVRDSYGFERLMPDDALIRSAVRAFQAGDITLLEQIVR